MPISLGAFAGILSERSGMLNIAIEGKFLIGACAAAIVASCRHRQRVSPIGVSPPRSSRRAGRSAARVARHPLRGRPDHRRRSRQHRRVGHHELPVPARALEEHVLNTPADDRGVPAAGALGRPGPRPAAVRGHAVPVLHDRLDAVPDLHAVPHAVGSTAASVGREAIRGGHGRHRRPPHPLPGDDPCGHARRARRLVPEPAPTPAASR